MKFYKYYLLIILILALSPTGRLWAEHNHSAHAEAEQMEHEPLKEVVKAKPNQVVIHVRGVVCSFCAHGLSKKLSKLDFVDKSKGSRKGITTDIRKGLVTVRLKPNSIVDTEGLKVAVESGGYEVIDILLPENVKKVTT